VALKNGMPAFNALFFASLGNILAIILNYFLGYWLYKKTNAKLTKSKVGNVALKYGHKYGYASLFLSWLPVIGDPITLVAGLLKLNFFYFLLISASFRFLRYYVLVIMM
jgi:membrane protein YqaA with SNARE-associated domain